MTQGLLFDVYPLDDKIVLWIKDKKSKRIEIPWTASLYVASTKSRLERLETNPVVKPLAKKFTRVNKTERASDTKKSKVLQITTKRSSEIINLAKNIERLDTFGRYRLYNVDVPPEQAYLYENDLYPLGEFKFNNNKWYGTSDICDTDYSIPNFKKVRLSVHAKSKGIPKFSDRIKKIQIDDVTLESDSEDQMILDCVDAIKKIDPDFIITANGDTWDFPFLALRAEKNKIADRLVFGREQNHLVQIPKRMGRSYFSYGQIHFKPTPIKLLGRIHIDESNCFIWEHEHSVHGIYEIARTCRLPLQTAARASIGKCMSSVQFYHATKRQLLIPWKPTVSEIFKTRLNLLKGDRGGLILEPRIGVHENVAEVDYASLFGNIMLQKNISAETINCSCCPDSDRIVPELGYRICMREGIVPESLRILLKKRQMYVDLLQSNPKSEIYKQRKAALKWILVTSFGYLGFNNAKFGRIDAHMAVCAFARNLLLNAIHTAEDDGFNVLHGIVDSIWINKKDATDQDYDNIRQKIQGKTGFAMSLDLYNWIAFVPSKESEKVPVPNRYFGAKKNQTLKLRGIGTRRHDTPDFFKRCQHDILDVFAKCNTLSEIRQAMVRAKSIQKSYQRQLDSRNVPLKDLTFTNRVTRGTDEHKTNTIQADVINQLKAAGKITRPGQKIRYFLHDSTRKTRRAIPLDLASSEKYDCKRYSELLYEYCRSITEPFDSC